MEDDPKHQPTDVGNSDHHCGLDDDDNCEHHHQQTLRRPTMTLLLVFTVQGAATGI